MKCQSSRSVSVLSNKRAGWRETRNQDVDEFFEDNTETSKSANVKMIMANVS